jgi:16S rRNA (uracil1498-N3)-methyltransferase
MAQLPRFFYDGPMAEKSNVSLDADTAKHIWQVLRMGTNDKVILTDGKGTSAEGHIYVAERHKCDIFIDKVFIHPRQGNTLHLCVGFTKNNSRNEWLLEKATELGVASIIPVLAFRSEKTYVRNERWHKILQSAILQSQQYYLPQLFDITPLHLVLGQFKDTQQKLIAHCIPEKSKRPLSEMLKPGADTILLIGPEGDFTQEEVNLCKEHGFKAVSFGAQRLRTETAALTAAAYFMVSNDEKN